MCLIAVNVVDGQVAETFICARSAHATFVLVAVKSNAFKSSESSAITPRTLSVFVMLSLALHLRFDAQFFLVGVTPSFLAGKHLFGVYQARSGSVFAAKATNVFFAAGIAVLAPSARINGDTAASTDPNHHNLKLPSLRIHGGRS